MSGGTADFFYREARRLKFVARSAFKVNSLNLPARRNLVEMMGFGCENLNSPRFWLQKQSEVWGFWGWQLVEIQKKHRIIRPGGSVLDLGCAPGAFLQVSRNFLTLLALLDSEHIRGCKGQLDGCVQSHGSLGFCLQSHGFWLCNVIEFIDDVIVALLLVGGLPKFGACGEGWRGRWN